MVCPDRRYDDDSDAEESNYDEATPQATGSIFGRDLGLLTVKKRASRPTDVTQLLAHEEERSSFWAQVWIWSLVP